MGIAVTDPRVGRKFPARDLVAGVWIGRGYEVAQYQLHEAVFPGRSAVVVSRFVKRWRDRGLIAVERWNKVGMNRLRLTTLGRDLLIHSAVAKPEDLFVPPRPVAPKDLTHRMWANDLRVVLGRLPRKPDLILPFWSIERTFLPRPAAVPDVLAVTVGPPSLLAIEVDLGGEPIQSVFVPKLHLLQEVLRAASKGGRAAILILTSGPRRQESIRTATVTLDGSIPIAVESLPGYAGREGLRTLEKMFTPGVKST